MKYVSRKSCSSVALSSLGLALPTHIKVRSNSCSISPRLQIPDSIRLSQKKRINFLHMISTYLKLSAVNNKKAKKPGNCRYKINRGLILKLILPHAYFHKNDRNVDPQCQRQVRKSLLRPCRRRKKFQLMLAGFEYQILCQNQCSGS